MLVGKNARNDMEKYFLKNFLLLVSCGYFSMDAMEFVTPSKTQGDRAVTTTPGQIDSAFDGFDLERLKKAGSKYKWQVQKKQTGAANLSATGIDKEFERMSLTQAQLAATKWKRKLESFASPISASSSPSRDFVSRGLSGNDLSGRFNSIAKESEEKKPEEMTHEELLEFTKDLLANKESSSSRDTRHDTATAIDPSAQDRELNRVFNGNRTMVGAYKTAVANGNLDGFWPVVKGEVIKNITECINKIQPGDANADLLIQPTWVFVVHAAKKGEFLSQVAEAINNLDFSNIAMPSNSSELMAFRSAYIRKINTVLEALIDSILPGVGKDSTVLHASIDPNRMGTNQSPRTKLAFRNVLLRAIG